MDQYESGLSDMSMASPNAVSYEDFGAAGDGTTDDFEAIRKAHEYANKNRFSIKTNPSKTYYIGESFSEIPVKTDVNWGTTRFIIDDSKIPPDNRLHAIFRVCSDQRETVFTVPCIKREQRKLDISLPANSLVIALNESKKQFIRLGDNQGAGADQTDCFVVDKSGNVLTPVVWDFESVTTLTAYPIEERTLRICGGIFTTIANQAESKYTYYERNIAIHRSNVIVDGVVHHIANELDKGAPYHGFFYVENSAFVTFKNCHVTGHKIYTTIGTGNRPVSMGSYDILLRGSIGITFLNCKQNDILNTSLWGCFGMNNCKNILVDGCVLSRVDSHMNVTNYIIKNSILGWQGLKAIGHGQMRVENVTIFAYDFIDFRRDYGSSWNGDLVIKDCIWYPLGKNRKKLTVISSSNTGAHDFGYTCSLPKKVTIKNLRVMDDEFNAEDYEGISIFSGNDNKDITDFENEPGDEYPYLFAKELVVDGLYSQSGKGFKIWDAIPVSCYGLQKHCIEKDKMTANFKAYINDVQHLIINNSLDISAGFKTNRRLLPYIEIRNCEDASIEQGEYPMIINIM